jgi:hypothetical protein
MAKSKLRQLVRFPWAAQGCLEAAYAQYKNAWAQTTVDMLVGKVNEELSERFSAEQRERVRKVFNAIKEAQTKRRQASQRELYRDRTTFDRASAKYAVRGSPGHMADANRGSAASSVLTRACQRALCACKSWPNNRICCGCWCARTESCCALRVTEGVLGCDAEYGHLVA